MTLLARLRAAIEQSKSDNGDYLYLGSPDPLLVDLLARIEALTSALDRLGGMEAFVLSRVIDPERDAELLARIDYARTALTAPSMKDIRDETTG